MGVYKKVKGDGARYIPPSGNKRPFNRPACRQTGVKNAQI